MTRIEPHLDAGVARESLNPTASEPPPIASQDATCVPKIMEGEPLEGFRSNRGLGPACSEAKPRNGSTPRAGLEPATLRLTGSCRC